MSFLLRRLSPDDAERAALVHRRAYDDRLPWLAGRHTPGEDLWYFRERVFKDCALWGALGQEGALLGFIALRDGWIDQLYVLPEWQGQGIGGALLAQAKSAWPQLRLWTFQKNLAARRFYEANGFTCIEETGGSRNEEGEPDALYLWRKQA